MNALRAEKAQFSSEPLHSAAAPFDPLFLKAVDAVFTLDDAGRRLDLEISDKPYEALIKISEELRAFGVSNNLASEFVEAIEAQAVHLGVDFTQKEKPTPLTIRLRVMDKKPQLDESKTHFMVAWDRNGKYGSDFSSVEAHLTNTGTKITTTNVPKFEDLFAHGNEKYLIAHFEKLEGEGVEGLDQAGVELATLVQAVGATAAAAMPEVRQAIEQKVFPAEAQQLVSTAAQINRVVEAARTQNAVQNPAAKIAELKTAVTQLNNNPQAKVQVIPPVLAEAVKVSIKAAEAVITPVVKNPVKANDSAAPVVISNVAATEARQNNQTHAPVSPVAALTAKIEKEFVQAPIVHGAQTVAKPAVEMQTQTVLVQNRIDVKPVVKADVISEQKSTLTAKTQDFSTASVSSRIQEGATPVKSAAANINIVTSVAPPKLAEAIAPTGQKAAPTPLHVELAAVPPKPVEILVKPSQVISAPVTQRTSIVEASNNTPPAKQISSPSLPPPSHQQPDNKFITPARPMNEEKQKFNSPTVPHMPTVVPEPVKSAPVALSAPLPVNSQPEPAKPFLQPINIQPPKPLPIGERPVNIVPDRKSSLPEYEPKNRDDFVRELKSHAGGGALPEPVRRVIDTVIEGRPLSYESMNAAAGALGGGKEVTAMFSRGTIMVDAPRPSIPTYSVFTDSKADSIKAGSFLRSEDRKSEIQITDEYNTCCGLGCKKGSPCKRDFTNAGKKTLQALDGFLEKKPTPTIS